ncbi:hypothetical protein NQ317_017083 [Molorchus minor]|uniref:Transposable element P transposase-like GTP-binding insertion domain-containing protein n=1 Tax=Molorchus minor TaxID=1323400 RepID=A0ABQ9K5Z7_9CUCU|nr:hypothetical protein NQ317_017083 [Molorchus minor]
MKVSLAAQIFSQRVASTMKGILRLAPDKLSNTAEGTAEFCLFMNNAFDSVNGTNINSNIELRCAVQSKSVHHDFWLEAIKTFESMKFLRSNGAQYVLPTVKNWIHSLKGLRYLWHTLNSKGFDFLSGKAECVLTKDPIKK